MPVCTYCLKILQLGGLHWYMSLSWTSFLENHGRVWEDTDRAACCVLGRARCS